MFAVKNRAMLSMHGGSIEITLTILLTWRQPKYMFYKFIPFTECVTLQLLYFS